MKSILIFIYGLLNLTKISADQYFCVSDEAGLNKCHDGGCNNPEFINGGEACVCNLSNGTMVGKYCGVYEDECMINPCKNDGKCLSGVGQQICECREGFYGYHCERPVKQNDKSIKIRKLSLFYRIKCSLGENLFLLLVSETFGNIDYHIFLRSAFNFRFKLSDFKEKIEVSKLINDVCLKKLDSKLFKVNKCDGDDSEDCQNMCNYISKIYGHDKIVEMAFVGPYFNSKTYIGKTDLFIDANNQTRIGLKYYLEVIFVSIDEDKAKYVVPFIQVIVDNEATVCLPFLKEIEYTKFVEGKQPLVKQSINDSTTIQINRKDKLKIGVIYNFESEKCPILHNESEYKCAVKIFEVDKPIKNYYRESNSKKLNANFAKIDYAAHLLDIDGFALPKGLYMILFSYYPINLMDTDDPAIPSVAVSYLFTLQSVIAKITGSSPMHVRDKLLTLNASESYNPNEKNADQKKNLLYTWECNITKDDSCNKFNTTNSITTLEKHLKYKDVAYTFTLTVRMDEDYIKTVGSPTEGIDTLVVIPDLPVEDLKKKIDIECIKNCKLLLNPTADLYLEAKTNFVGTEFKWYYSNDTQIKSVDNIAVMDVPTNILVVKKNMLDYGTTYSFIVKYPKYNLENNINKTTVSRPVISNCIIQPQSGEAGITLFNISCTNFSLDNNAEYFFEYYQRNKNDVTNDQNPQLSDSSDYYGATNGVLLYRGNDSMINIKLSCSKHLTVRKINKQGITADVNLLVDISGCDKNLLNSLFKELKTNLMNNDNSRAVTIIAILSDILHDNHINKFDKLFMALNQIPIENCIPCTYQFSLILKKVINDYYKTVESNINIAKLISKQLVRVSHSLSDFVSTNNFDNRGTEIQEIDKIKQGLQKNVASLQNSILQYNKENDTNRHYWSSINNNKITTHNLEKLLTSFGKSIILDLSTYKRSVSCADDNYLFEACIVSPEWLRNRSRLASNTLMYDTIGDALARELLLKGGDWGITIFNLKNDLKRTFDKTDEIKIILPIVLLDVTNFNYLNLTDLRKHNEFENYFDLHFKTKENIHRPLKSYTIQVPAPDTNNLEFDKIIMVYRIDMSNIAELFLTISDLSHDIRFVWLRDKRPDIEMMKDQSYSHTLKSGKKHEFKLKTLSEHRNEIHYVGISVDMNEKLARSSVLKVKFSMDIFSPQCLYWTGIKWKSDGIIIGPNSTENDLHCQTKHTSLFTGLLRTLPDVEDPFVEIAHIEAIANNLVCVLAVSIVFLIYLILLGWSVYQDNKDVSRGSIIILNDNYPGEDEVYYVTVYTGNMPESGTTANVCIQLYGNDSASRAHWLNGSGGDVLQRFHDDKFIILTPQSLGDLEYIHIWHDSHGSCPNWYCKRIEVTDVRTEKTWYFEVERWFSLLMGVKNTEHIISAKILQNRKTQFIDEVVLNIREEHLWISVFLRHPRSSATRCQRLSNILCAQLSVMLTNLLFYQYVQDDDEYFISLEITPTQIWIAVFSNLIEISMTFFTSYFFNKSSELQENSIIQNQVDDNAEIEKTWWKKLLSVITEEKLYSPAQTEINLQERKGTTYWIIGWIICIAIYIITSVFIILYGLKFGKVKSLHWITTIVIGVLQSTLVVEPLLIAISSLVWWFLSDQEQNKINNYQIKLDNFRKNTKNQLRNFRLIRRIRENRYRYLYSPLTTEKAQTLQNEQKIKIHRSHLLENFSTCLLVIIISLCCRSALYNTQQFLTPELIQTNIINKIFLENLFERNVMDLEMIKTFLSESLVPHLHVKEYYNGISITNISMNESNGVRGRFSLYNSKLINGGVRLTQNRIRQDNYKWEVDIGIYAEEWRHIDDTEEPTAWTYRSIPVIKYFNIWSPVKINSGFILDLIGDQSEYQNTLDTHLENGWLDNRTTSLGIEFQMYTPIADCITVFKLGFETTSGSLYAVNKEVWTVPSSAAFVTLTTHVFTLVSVCAYAAAAVWLTTVWLTAPAWLAADGDPGAAGRRRFWTAYEWTLMALVACTAFAVAGRRQLMTVAGDRYAAVRETAYAASVVDACHAHEHVGALATVTAFAAAVRAFALEWSS